MSQHFDTIVVGAGAAGCVLASRLINGLASFVLGYGIRDYDSGFVVLRRGVFDKVSVIPTGYGAYFMEFLYNCRRKGLTVHEVRKL